MRVINVMKQPYEFTFDSCQYGPILPGQVVDLPAEVALHAIKRSVILDEEGEIIGFKIKDVAEVGQDELKEIALYPCPMEQVGRCKAKPFKSYADLMRHMETHAEASEKTLRK